MNIYAVCRRKRAIDLTYAHDHGPIILNQTGKMTADIAQALHHDAFAREIPLELGLFDQFGMAKEFLQDILYAASSGFAAAANAPLCYGFARDASDRVQTVGMHHIV